MFSFDLPQRRTGHSSVWPLAIALLLGLAISFLCVVSAFAQPVLEGFVRAGTDCPATPAIRSTDNPGEVRLVPGRTYRLLAQNRADGTHFLVVTPGASPEKRWIEKTCGERVASAGNLPRSVPDAAASSSSTPAAPQRERRSDGDRRMQGARAIVAMNWQPAFCETSGREECRTQTTDRFDASNFALHGLWPQPRGREFCGVDAPLRALDEDGDWTKLPAPDLSTATRRALDTAMPGTRSGLDRHEWVRHGTCYGGDAEDYFGDSLQVLEAVNASAVRDLFAASVGNSVTLEAVREAFDQSFGAGTGDRVRLTCRRDGGRELVSEITLGLAGEIRPGADLSKLILAAPKARGGCSQGVVDAVGRQ